MFKKVHYILVSISPQGDMETSKKTKLHNSKKKCCPAHKQLSMIMRIWIMPWRCLSERSLDELKTYHLLQTALQSSGSSVSKVAGENEVQQTSGKKQHELGGEEDIKQYWLESTCLFSSLCPCCEQKMLKQFYTANTNLWFIILPAGYVQQHTGPRLHNTTPANRIFLRCLELTQGLLWKLCSDMHDDRTLRAIQDHKTLTLKGLLGKQKQTKSFR